MATLTMGQQVGWGAILFEGYSQILVDSKHMGYVIQRYEHNPKKKELISKYYIQTSPALGGRRESLIAHSTEKFQPLSYRYTDRGPNHKRIIEARFKKNLMQGYVFDGKTKKQFQKRFPNGTFLSTFLGYLILNKGYREGVKFTFSAISEEDGDVFSGESYVKEATHRGGFKVFKVLNKFKGSQFTSLISPQGEVLSTHSPMQRVSTQITSFKAATKGYSLDKKSLRAIFGEIPQGTKNIYAQRLLRAKAKTRQPQRKKGGNDSPQTRQPQREENDIKRKHGVSL